MSVLTAFWPFRRSRADEDGERLLVTVTQIARQPEFFGENRIPDTLEGRLELVMLHAGLALMRLRAEAGAGPAAQAFTDQLFRHFDAGLREAGVGDLAVPKRMHKIAGAFYGRLNAYSTALDAQDRPALEAALARNIFAADPARAGFSGVLAGYMRDAHQTQAGAPLEALLRLDGWPRAPV